MCELTAPIRIMMRSCPSSGKSSASGGPSCDPVIAMRTAGMRVIAERWPEAVARDPYRNPWVEVGEVAEARFPWSLGDAS